MPEINIKFNQVLAHVHLIAKVLIVKISDSKLI